jgi:hypothetical protein
MTSLALSSRQSVESIEPSEPSTLVISHDVESNKGGMAYPVLLTVVLALNKWGIHDVCTAVVDFANPPPGRVLPRSAFEDDDDDDSGLDLDLVAAEMKRWCEAVMALPTHMRKVVYGDLRENRAGFEGVPDAVSPLDPVTLGTRATDDLWGVGTGFAVWAKHCHENENAKVPCWKRQAIFQVYV